MAPLRRPLPVRWYSVRLPPMSLHEENRTREPQRRGLHRRPPLLPGPALAHRRPQTTYRPLPDLEAQHRQPLLDLDRRRRRRRREEEGLVRPDLAAPLRPWRHRLPLLRLAAPEQPGVVVLAAAAASEVVDSGEEATTKMAPPLLRMYLDPLRRLPAVRRWMLRPDLEGPPLARRLQQPQPLRSDNAFRAKVPGKRRTEKIRRTLRHRPRKLLRRRIKPRETSSSPPFGLASKKSARN
mmetsp:Transcript_37622/g.79321  ORF Transcript_37622/g.79321 Transcript_37622/m.79321 type:complete len:238 (+) Transcript_37622:733-1446(+)